MESTIDKPFLILSIVSVSATPTFLTNLSSDTERTWKQSAEDSLDNLLVLSGINFTIQGAIVYLSFQSVTGTTIFNGNFPRALSFTMIAGLIFFISAPTVGSKLINQISPCFIKRLSIQYRKCSQIFIGAIIIV